MCGRFASRTRSPSDSIALRGRWLGCRRRARPFGRRWLRCRLRSGTQPLVFRSGQRAKAEVAEGLSVVVTCITHDDLDGLGAAGPVGGAGFCLDDPTNLPLLVDFAL